MLESLDTTGWPVAGRTRKPHAKAAVRQQRSKKKVRGFNYFLRSQSNALFQSFSSAIPKKIMAQLSVRVILDGEDRELFPYANQMMDVLIYLANNQVLHPFKKKKNKHTQHTKEEKLFSYSAFPETLNPPCRPVHACFSGSSGEC